MLNYTPIDVKYDIEAKLESSSRVVKTLLADKSFDPADILTNHINKGQIGAYEDVQFGLLYILLTEQNTTAPYTLLVTTTKDALALVINTCSRIIAQKWNKLVPIVANQLLWLFAELIKSLSPRLEIFIIAFLRTFGGSDLSDQKLKLIDIIVSILSTNLDWTNQYPSVIPSVVFTFLRLMEDHSYEKLLGLRKKEANLCNFLLRNHWANCAEIGRDLIRLLHNVSSVPEIEEFFKELMARQPSGNQIWPVLRKRTTGVYLSLPLTYEMEERIRFMLTSVRFGHERIYFEWFRAEYLYSELTDPVRVDIIRYLCCAHHPTNEQLSSDLITRYSLIGWLFCECSRRSASANMRLAVFYDWLFFEADKDIMDIEPAVLLLLNSFRVNLPLALNLTDFLCRIGTIYYPPQSDAIHESIQSAMRCVVNKKVINSFSVLFDNEFIPQDLSLAVQHYFSQFCQSRGSEDSGMSSDAKEDEENLEIPSRRTIRSISSLGEDETGTKINYRDHIQIVLMAEIVKFRKNIFQNSFDQLSEVQKGLLGVCVDERNSSSKRSEAFDRLLNLIIINESWMTISESGTCIGQSLAVCVAWIIHDYLNNQTSENSSLHPFISVLSSNNFFDFFVFNLFGLLLQLHGANSGVLALSSFYGKVAEIFPMIGYLLLIYLQKRNGSEKDKFDCYSALCGQLGWDLSSRLTEDVILAIKYDMDAVVDLLLALSRSSVEDILIDNCTFIRALCSKMSCKELDRLNCAILRKELVLITEEGIESVLHIMSKLAVHSQQTIWVLIQSHCLLVESYLTFLSDFEVSDSFSHLIYLITTDAIICRKPTMELISCLMSLSGPSVSPIISTALSFWASDDVDKLSNVLGTLLSRQNKRLKRVKHHIPVSAVIKHLDSYRKNCRDLSLLFNKNLTDGLSAAYSLCDDSVKTTYAELFSLAGCGDFDYRAIRESEKHDIS